MTYVNSIVRIMFRLNTKEHLDTIDSIILRLTTIPTNPTPIFHKKHSLHKEVCVKCEKPKNKHEILNPKPFSYFRLYFMIIGNHQSTVNSNET
jgi:hypothetical protein